MRTIWRLNEPRILLHFKRKRQVVPRQRTNSPPHLTSNTQQWHLLSSPMALAPASSAFVIETVCAAGCSRSVGRWCWTEEKPWYRLFGHGLVWELSTRRTEGKNSHGRGRERRWAGLHFASFSSKFPVTTKSDSVLAPRLSARCSPTHSHLVQLQHHHWCGQRLMRTSGRRRVEGRSFKPHDFFFFLNLSRCLHSWYLTLAASKESPVVFVDKNVTEPIASENKQETHWEL